MRIKPHVQVDLTTSHITFDPQGADIYISLGIDRSVRPAVQDLWPIIIDVNTANELAGIELLSPYNYAVRGKVEKPEGGMYARLECVLTDGVMPLNGPDVIFDGEQRVLQVSVPGGPEAARIWRGARDVWVGASEMGQVSRLWIVLPRSISDALAKRCAAMWDSR